MITAKTILKRELKLWKEEYLDSKRWSKQRDESVRNIGLKGMKKAQQNIKHLEKAIKILNEAL